MSGGPQLLVVLLGAGRRHIRLPVLILGSRQGHALAVVVTYIHHVDLVHATVLVLVLVHQAVDHGIVLILDVANCLTVLVHHENIYACNRTWMTWSHGPIVPNYTWNLAK